MNRAMFNLIGWIVVSLSMLVVCSIFVAEGLAGLAGLIAGLGFVIGIIGLTGCFAIWLCG